MKGTSFQKPLEFKIAVEGETWHQGDKIEGVLTVKNHDSAPQEIKGARVSLALGDLDGVRKKEAGSFEVITTSPEVPPFRLESQAETPLSWKFDLDLNCPISAKSNSLFLLYGSDDNPEKLGNLQLAVSPHQLILDYVSLLTIEFQFVHKLQKSNKGWVEIKFAPPAARSFAVVENLVASFRREGENLVIKHAFATKKIDAAAGMNLKKSKQSFEQTFNPNQYLLSNGRLNHEKIGAAFREVLDQLGLGALA